MSALNMHEFPGPHWRTSRRLPDSLGYSPPNENVLRRHKLENASNAAGLTEYNDGARHGLGVKHQNIA